MKDLRGIKPIQGKAKPAQYIILPPSRYDENFYNVVHNTSNCTASIEAITLGFREENVTVLTCPYGELLLNGITQANLEDGVSDSDIRTFYTWEDRSLPTEAFVTLQFPNNTITPTRVAIYFLEMRDLRAREPFRIRLYSSSTESIFPNDDDEIRANDNQVTIESGTTNQNEDFEYIRCDLTIPEENQVPLNYLRIEFRYFLWIFIAEVEVYHLVEPLHDSTSEQAPSSYMQVHASSVMASPSTTSLSIMASTTATTSSLATVVLSSDGNRSDNNDGSVSVAVFIGTVVGTLLLTIFIIMMIVMILYWRNRKSRRADDKDAQSSSTNYPQQHAPDISRIDSSRIKITPNPSYNCVGPISSQSEKKSEYEYIQIDHGLVGHDKVPESMISGGVTMDTVNFDPNPAYLVGQDVILEENPSYNMLQL